ncbi:MAG: ribosome-associated heat shock protein Hsp15 [Hahellaceae bacterium]|jgi:ribosome-associated heat shock protein Hsp15|nr:ribosome-associated heat shock protein Hsp15 [Hahellaceae bacterium]MCP5210207.1 ribosome-associated heat shock protein Hsp15 [Hahellaceae bacterium]
MQQQVADDKVRLDKWLWAARFFKTRSLAKDAIDGGKVHYNGARTKPGKAVETGARLRIRQGWDEKEVVVIALAEKRKGAKEAVLLYQETEKSIVDREAHAWQRKQMQMASLPPARRPTKKQRRDIIKFKDQE